MKSPKNWLILLFIALNCPVAGAADYEAICVQSNSGGAGLGMSPPSSCVSCEKKVNAKPQILSCGKKNLSYCEYQIHCKGTGVGSSTPHSSFDTNNYFNFAQIGESDFVVRCQASDDGSCPTSKECFTRKNISGSSDEYRVINFSEKEGAR